MSRKKKVIADGSELTEMEWNGGTVRLQLPSTKGVASQGRKMEKKEKMKNCIILWL